MADNEHVQHHVAVAREACLDLRSAIIDLVPNEADAAELLVELAKVQQQLKFLSYTSMPWTT